MGILDRVFKVCDVPRPSHWKPKKRKQLQVVEIKIKIKIKMDCEGCERSIRKSVEGMKGVNHFEVNPKQSKLMVTGYVEPKKVLEHVRYRTGKAAELWSYVLYGVVGHPYAPGAYDKKAPPGYVRNVLHNTHASALTRAGSTKVKYTTAFSDDNPNACVVM